MGTFDLPHYGHYNFLSVCDEISDDVIVGVNSDEFVHKYKGEKPLMTQSERKKTLSLWGYNTHINPSEGRDLIEVVKPDIIAIGSDWARKDYLKQIDVTQDDLDDWGVALIYIPYTQGISTTEIKKRVHGSSNNS